MLLFIKDLYLFLFVRNELDAPPKYLQPKIFNYHCYMSYIRLACYRTSSNSSSIGSFVWLHHVPLLHSTYVTKREIHARGRGVAL